MLDGIEALAALSQFGTVSEAAVRLRLTQSAVSKRLRALEVTVGFPLVEPDGRRVRLTARGVEFLQRARPLVAELRSLSHEHAGPVLSSLSLALADSIASSWGPRVVSAALEALPSLQVNLHAHRSVLVVESVRLGRYHAGLCTAPGATEDLVTHSLVREKMVLLHSRFGARADRRRPLICIEASSATFREIEPALRQHHAELLGGRLVPVESFGAVVQMAKAGFGDGIVPLGLAREMQLPEEGYRELSGVARSIVLVTRKTIAQQERFQRLRDELRRSAELAV